MIKKRPRFELASGLRNSLKVLERLKNRTELAGYTILVGAFTNCREVGLTFYVASINGVYFDNKKTKTFCIYEHRNSDDIIINGKEGYVNCNGDLPYNGDSKYDYLASVPYKDYDLAANALVNLILKIK